MGIEHVYVVYDPATTNRFDLGRRLVRGIELTHFQLESAASATANQLLLQARLANTLIEHANAATNAAGDIADLAAAEAAARAATAAALEAQHAEDTFNRDYGADSEDHTRGGADGDEAPPVAPPVAPPIPLPVITSFGLLSLPLLDTYTDVVNTTYTLVPNFIGGTAQIQLPDGGYLTGDVTTGQLLGRTVLLGTNTYTLRVTNATGVATKTFTVTGTNTSTAPTPTITILDAVGNPIDSTIGLLRGHSFRLVYTVPVNASELFTFYLNDPDNPEYAHAPSFFFDSMGAPVSSTTGNVRTETISITLASLSNIDFDNRYGGDNRYDLFIALNDSSNDNELLVLSQVRVYR